MYARLIILISLILAIIPIRLGTLTVQAGTVNVTNTNDSGSGSLRQAVADANSGDTVNFSLTYPTTITLTSGNITIAKNLTINGPGASNLTLSGNNSSRVFFINSGYAVAISGLTFTRANDTSVYNSSSKVSITNCIFTQNLHNWSGGALYNYGTLTVTNSIFSNNGGTTSGGAIYSNGPLTITGSTFSNNIGSYGAAIYNSSYTMTVSNSTFLSNSVTSSGGAIYNSSAKLMLTDSAFNQNSASGVSAGTGGALYNNNGTLTIAGVSFVGNTASTNGGAVYSYLGGLTFNNTTFISNTSSGNGGSVYNNGTMTFTNSTFSGNTASNLGGGFYNQRAVTMTNVTIAANNGGGFLQFGETYTSALLKNTIIANNSTSNCTLSKQITSAGYNLSSDNSCETSFNSATDLNYTNPLLAPLVLNAPGSAKIHALLPNSPAIDGGTNTGCPAIDQRGMPRPLDGDRNGSAICDIGAYEKSPFDLNLPLVQR